MRRMAAEDPRQAREFFLSLLDGRSPALDEFLKLVSSPGEGRLRQLVANAVRTRPDKGGLTTHLMQWHEIETDEFAKRAISAALSDVARSTLVRPSAVTPANAELVETYRYVAGRLHHQLRNALMRPNAQVIKLRKEVREIADDVERARLATLVGALSDDLVRVTRIIEEFDPEDEYFRLRNIALLDWLIAMNAEYARKYAQVDLQIHDSAREAGSLYIVANDYLLTTVFWNLWINAQEAVGLGCRIEVVVTSHAGRVELAILDNGDGFPPERVGVAFTERFSSAGKNRGRGLLEVQDAIQQLHGDVRLYEHLPGDFRIKIRFPLSQV